MLATYHHVKRMHEDASRHEQREYANWQILREANHPDAEQAFQHWYYARCFAAGLFAALQAIHNEMGYA